MLRRLAVFGSRTELAGPDELAAAHRLGRLIGEQSVTVVSDGAPAGTLAVLVEAASKAGGRLIGVSVSDATEPARADLTEHRRVADAAAWRSEIGSLAEAWLALPGAFENLEDAFALWAWTARPPKEQPLGLLDSADYYSSLLKTASDPAVDRFVLESQRGRLVVAKDPAELLRRLSEYRPPETRRDTFDDD
ncbi:MAG: LOG family protein [Gemmatimonadetes bacterium]|nr:LOG family protein [Gemmatimonadota bacterium]